jgi:chromosome partitioning protein
MTIITVAQRKGGVGKTTLAVCLAGELTARNFGVALIDSDPQRSACHWAELGNLEFPVHEIGLETETVASWAKEVKRVQSDIVMIDTAPSERQLGASIAIADLILVPCTASGLDVEATYRTMRIINAVRQRRASSVSVILIPNRVDRRTLEGRQLENELRGIGETVSPPVGYRSAFVRAFNTGQSVADMARGAPADLEIKALCDLVVRKIKRPDKTRPSFP